jgi:4-hydroxybenzoate polyprenyltransferase
MSGNASGFTDIRRGGWVALLPAAVQNYVLLARADRPIGTWLLFLPGVWAICLAAPGVWRGLWLVLLFALGAVVMRGAGCVVNDLWDRDLDAQVERTRGRPLASGAVKPWAALLFLAVLCLIGLGVLLLLGRTAQILGVLSLALVALYPLAKRVTWWPQLVLGCVFGWGAPMGYAAASGHLSWPVLPLYAGTILWILGYDTIYAHQDREDDALIGVKSTARLFGAHTGWLLAGCYGGLLLLLAAAMRLSGLHAAGFWLLLAPAALLAGQIILLDINDPARCLALFKLNREVGLLIALAILAGRF